MARTEITVQNGTIAGATLVTEVAADSGNGMQFTNDGNTILLLSNEHGSNSYTVSLPTINSDRFGRTKTVSQAVAAGRLAIIGPLDPGIFNNSSGKVEVDLTGSTSLVVAAIRLKQ